MGISRSGEGKHAVGRRHEILALDRVEQIQHFLVEHFPGADLVLDHVETGLFQVSSQTWQLGSRR